MSDKIQELRTRRGVLAGVLGGVVGLVGSRFAAPPAARAADGEPALLGVGNTAASRTGFTATADDGVVAQSDNIGGTGVVAIGDYGLYGTGGVGVMGDVASGGTGVYAFVGDAAAPAPTVNTALVASAPSTAHTALRVNGKTSFSRSGRMTVAAGYSSVGRTLAGVTTSSLIIGTIQTNRAGYYVQAAVPASGSFRIYLNKTATAATNVAYFIIN